MGQINDTLVTGSTDVPVPTVYWNNANPIPAQPPNPDPTNALPPVNIIQLDPDYYAIVDMLQQLTAAIYALTAAVQSR